MTISYEDFEKVEIRSGTVIQIEPFPRAKKPAYKVCVDFGKDIGKKWTSAQVTARYIPEILLGRQVIGCVNLGERILQGLFQSF